MTDENCRKCLGRGLVANDDGNTSWSAWEALPPESNMAVKLGIVRPIPCPVCGGEEPPQEVFSDNENDMIDLIRFSLEHVGGKDYDEQAVLLFKALREAGWTK